MDTRSMRDLGPLEQRVLELLWQRPGRLSVREVQAAMGSELAYTTVMTTLDRLYKKGLLERGREGRAYRYAARSTREAFAAGLLRRSLDRLLGRESVRPLLSTLVDAVGERDRELLPELERLVREKERSLRRRGR
jgi:predicted transcriptional regulator